MQLIVVIASAGRPEVCAELAQWSAGIQVPEGADLRWMLSTPETADAPDDLPATWTSLQGVRGASAQRNLALDQCGQPDFVFFFDDDALPRQDYLVAAVGHFGDHPEHVALTGRLLRDGAVEKREIPFVEAVTAIETSWSQPPPVVTAPWRATKELYGCNFAVRWSAAADLRFEERFPLYSWLEDLDYAARLRERGQLVQLSTAMAVHRGVDSGGRTQHLRMGYSQVANPALMVAKGTLSWADALAKTGRPLARNLAGVVLPGDRRARRDRVKGNALALRDLILAKGKATPERILDL